MTPWVIIEVLSPSTSATDRIVKNGEYQAMPSIQCYVILEQDRVASREREKIGLAISSWMTRSSLCRILRRHRLHDRGNHRAIRIPPNPHSPKLHMDFPRGQHQAIARDDPGDRKVRPFLPNLMKPKTSVIFIAAEAPMPSTLPRQPPLADFPTPPQEKLRTSSMRALKRNQSTFGSFLSTGPPHAN